MRHVAEHPALACQYLMQLKILAAAIDPRRVIGPLDRSIESIAYDSRRVAKNSLFVALTGERTDGHQFIDQAIDKGASVIVTEREEKNSRATCLVVENTRDALADLAAAFYERPARRLKMAGVTGTNGKTTTTFLLKHICEKAGLRCGLIGTVRYEIGERVLPATRTTPESLDLQELLAQIFERGVQSGCDGGFIPRAGAGTNARPRVGCRGLHESHTGSSRLSRDDGKLL